MADGTCNSASEIIGQGSISFNTITKQAKKVYKYKQNKKQTSAFNRIEVYLKSLDVEIRKSSNEKFDIEASYGDIAIKLGKKYLDKLGINMFTKGGNIYTSKIYKGIKKEKGNGYLYKRNANGSAELKADITGYGDVKLL